MLITDLFDKFKKLVEEYRLQIRREEEALEERRQINLLKEEEREQNSSRYGGNNSNDNIQKSLRNIFGRKKDFDLYSNKSKDDDPKTPTKIRNTFSLTEKVN